MSKHKIRYILPLLAIMTSATCVSAAGSSDKAANAVKPKQEKNLCPEPVDQMDEDCLEITLLKLENKLDMKYKDLFRRAATKDQKLHGMTKQYFTSIRSKWEAYQDELCYDPTVTTDLKTPADRIHTLCAIEQTQLHLKALERF
ncbi:hypothetical protein ACTHT4_04220 [Neisseria sp. P0022.S007]|uniref:hypothetical protein n=1 Tax=unclassified Neisseria TaxID=2623750 RepID=UPI003F81C57F